MRMHPRRHGAYNFAARTASFIVNERYKKKNSPSDNSGCATIFVICLLLFGLLNACAKL